MGSEQLAGVMSTIGREAAARGGRTLNEEQAAAMAAQLKARVEATAESFMISSECLDDGVIDPRHTRICLSVVHNQLIESSAAYGISRM